MASEWFCRALGKEMGPVAFRDLVEMVRAGTLTEDDPVRRKGSRDWTAAGEVIGLFRAAGREVAEAAPPAPKLEAEPPPAAKEPETPSRPAPKVPRTRRRVWVTIGSGVLLVVVAAVGVWGWGSREDRKFPEPRLATPRPLEEDQLESLMGPRPEVPSVPGLEERVPELVPGLEQFEPAFSPCLTPDLRTIVFAHLSDFRTGYDLYLASRDEVTLPFSQPRRIEGSVSGQMDGYPALSPDGLELIFARSDKLPRFFSCTRPTSSSDFGEAVPWEPPGLVPTESQRLERPQFIDARSVVFAMVSTDGQDRAFWSVDRAAPQSAFGPARQFPFSNPWPPYFVAESGLRAYYGCEKGIFVMARRSKEQPFFEGFPLIDAAVTGPIEGPVWGTPQEDVVFYCSAGPGEELGSARKLWMIRF